MNGILGCVCMKVRTSGLTGLCAFLDVSHSDAWSVCLLGAVFF